MFVEAAHRRMQCSQLVLGQRRHCDHHLELPIDLAGQAGGTEAAQPEGAAEGAVARCRGGESEQICDRSRT